MHAANGNSTPQRRGGLARAGVTAWSLLGMAALVYVAAWLVGRLMPVLLPFVVAILLSTLLRPVAAALQRAGVRPALAAFLVVTLAVAVIGGLGWLIVPPFVERLAELGQSLDEGLRQVAYSVGHGLAGLSHGEVDQMIDRALARIRDHLGGVAGEAVAGLSSAVGVLASAVLVVFLSFFIVRDGRRLWTWIVELAPERRRDGVDAMGERAWEVLTAYTRGVVFVATVDAVLIGIALLVVGVPLALPLIVLTWIAAFFPIVGAVTAGAAAVLVALVANGLTSALIILAAIVLVQQLEGNVLYPVVVGPRLRLHPIVVLMAVAVGGTLAGIPGAFLAVPVATVGGAILGYQREQRARRQAAAREPARRGVVMPTGPR
jgi:predicted PurR-regulated permease PerM